MVHDRPIVAAHFDSRSDAGRIVSSGPIVRGSAASLMRHARRAATLVGLLLASSAASANGRFPSAQHLVGGPGGAAQSLAVRTTFGIVTSADGGRSWRYHCEDLLGISTTSGWDAPIALATDGALFAGLPDGLARITDGCTAPRVAEVGRDFTADLTTTRDGATLYWIGSSGPQGNRVLASTDGGRTFAMRGSARDGVLLETIEASDVDPRRVYVSGVQLEPRAFVLFRSDDGARTFREIPLAVPGITGAYLAGLDRDSADGLWIRAPMRPTDGPEGGTALLHSRDGGEHFEQVARTRGPMMGFAVRGDGASVWYGGPDDGLWRSANGGVFSRVADLPITCLRWHADALYACANHLRTGWAVARSQDEGARFDPLLRFEDLTGPPRCPSGTLGGDVCPGRWSVLRRTLQPDGGAPLDAGVPARDASTTGLDAGSAATPPAREDCGCAVPGSSPSRGGLALVTLVLLTFARRRARRGAMLPRPCSDSPSV